MKLDKVRKELQELIDGPIAQVAKIQQLEAQLRLANEELATLRPSITPDIDAAVKHGEHRERARCMAIIDLEKHRCAAKLDRHDSASNEYEKWWNALLVLNRAWTELGFENTSEPPGHKKRD